MWQSLIDAGAALFPGARGRIPNFVGAGQAAEHLSGLEVWRSARVLKCNPDLPQRPVRQRALEEGKTVYMAVPRLTSERCFLELDPLRIPNPRYASSIKGAAAVGRPVVPAEMQRVDLIVCGAVAAGADGARLGKGGGYSDLEYALARSLGLIGPETPVVTTVHSLQVVPDPIPMTRHDISLDAFATPEGVTLCHSLYRKPEGIYWDELGEKLEEIPVLRQLKLDAHIE